MCPMSIIAVCAIIFMVLFIFWQFKMLKKYALKYDKFKISYREEDHQLYLEYNDIVKMYDAILDFMDRAFRIITQG